jgi:hypothetical protein
MKNRKIQIHPSEYFTQRTQTAAHQFHLKVVRRGEEMGDRWWLLSHTNGISSSFPSELCLPVFFLE